MPNLTKAHAKATQLPVFLVESLRKVATDVAVTDAVCEGALLPQDDDEDDDSDDNDESNDKGSGYRCSSGSSCYGLGYGLGFKMLRGDHLLAVMVIVTRA